MAESYCRSWRVWRSRLRAMGLASATESYAASALYTTLASLSDVIWRIRRARRCTLTQPHAIRSGGSLSYRNRPDHGAPAIVGDGDTCPRRTRARFIRQRAAGARPRARHARSKARCTAHRIAVFRLHLPLPQLVYQSRGYSLGRRAEMAAGADCSAQHNRDGILLLQLRAGLRAAAQPEPHACPAGVSAK